MDWNWLNDFVDWWTSQRAAAVAACVGATAAVTAATSGVRTLRQNRRDSKSRNRPMVAAELRFDPYAEKVQMLVVRNYGPSIARNVKVTFDPEIPDPEDPSQSMTPFLKNRYAKIIPVLTPGMELDNIYYSGRPGDDGKLVNREPTPEQVTVTITYENDTGDRFTDEFPLDTKLIGDRTYATSSASPEAQMKVIATSLKGLHEIANRADSARRREEFDQARAEFERADEPPAKPPTLPTGEPANHQSILRRLLPHKYRD